MTHSTAENDSIEIVDADDPFDILAGLEEADDHPGRTDALAASGRVWEPYPDLPRAKPGELPTRGFDPEKILGICADELDDEFLEEVMVPSSQNAAREKRS